MDLKENEVYKIIGKVENINTGAHFSNTTVLKQDGEHVNIKLEFEQLKDIKMGKIYEFEALSVLKLEDELILKLQSLKDIEDVLDSDELSKLLDYYYVYAPIPMADIKKGIEGFLSKIENKALADITKTIYDKHKKTFYMHPAATKFHHAYVGGLSYHTLTMLKLIDPFLEIYTYLNKDLLYAATILHDMSKISEISGVDGEYTKEGLLIGHLVMQTIDVDQAAKQLGYEELEEVLILKHMILSHHGQLHYGSPKKPQTGEALLLWFIDTIDSKFTVLGEVLDTTLEGQFTQMVSVLDKMRFYKPNLKK
jgi:3'-5' exoribonuclease